MEQFSPQLSDTHRHLCDCPTGNGRREGDDRSPELSHDLDLPPPDRLVVNPVSLLVQGAARLGRERRAEKELYSRVETRAHDLFAERNEGWNQHELIELLIEEYKVGRSVAASAVSTLRSLGLARDEFGTGMLVPTDRFKTP